jgi:acyl carrier protein
LTLCVDAKQSAKLRRALQEEFGVEVPKVEAKELATVGDLTRFIQSQLHT